MSAIWREGAQGWELLSPEGFPNEHALHSLVEATPELLPLSGSPDLVVLGREVALGPGKADLLAIEMTGRPVIIEVKLARNSEARRAVVAQVLTYAAFLQGVTPEALEREVLSRHLHLAGHRTVRDAVSAEDQRGAFDPDVFDAGLRDSLRTGRFRLVLVLDDAPQELVTLVGYLESVSDGLTIDLVTVANYEVGDTSVMVPQRVDPEKTDRSEGSSTTEHRSGQGTTTPGADAFLAAITELDPEDQPALRRLAEWACVLESEGLCRLSTYQGVGANRYTLLPRLQPDNAGLITVWNDHGIASMQFWRSVFERRAPRTLAEITSRYGDDAVRQGNTAPEPDDELLSLLASAYREANGQ